MALTPDLVALCERVVADPGPEPDRPVLTDAEIEAKAVRIDAECGDAPVWLFAYGSLIWKPVFEAAELRTATAVGWHRSFCMDMRRWRGSDEQPGLMMAIVRGGTCRGVAYRLPAEGRRDVITQMISRETSSPDDLNTVRWLDVNTDAGKVRALSFWVGPKGSFILDKLPLEEAARRIARACGHVGSNAAYLYNTVLKLGEFGIRDRNLWRLQELVAMEITAMTAAEPLAAVG
jgi:cation transport protein ChaC